MNRIYRSIWNTTLACWVAAPETAKAAGSGGQKAAGSKLLSTSRSFFKEKNVFQPLAAGLALVGVFGTPAFGAELIIKNGESLTIAGGFYDGGLIEAGGAVHFTNILNNNALGVMQNFGTITTNTHGGVANYGEFYNRSGGSIIAEGKIYNNPGALFDNAGEIVVRSEFVRGQDSVFLNSGRLTINDVNNTNGLLQITSNARVENQNNGVIVINDSTNTNTGTAGKGFLIDGSGVFLNNAGSLFENNSKAEVAGYFYNSGTVENNNTINYLGAKAFDNLGGVLNNSGTFSLSSNSLFDNSGGTLNNTGTFEMSGGGAFDNSGGTINNSGTFTFTDGKISNNSGGTINNSNAFTIGSAAAAAGINPVLNNNLGAKFVNQAAGVITVESNGQIANYGVLQNDGKLIFANQGTFDNYGKLYGVGEINGNVIMKAGSLVNAGNALTPYGTLTIDGNLTFELGAVLEIEARPGSTQSSQLIINGTANLNGSVLHLDMDQQGYGDYKGGEEYKILTATAYSGKFDKVESEFAYLEADLDYRSNEIFLILSRNDVSFNTYGRTPNQIATANAVDGMSNTSETYDFVQGLTKDEVPDVLSRLSGDVHANWQAGLRSLSSHASGLGWQRLHRNLTAGYRPGAPVAQSAGVLPASAWPSAKALPVWAEVIGHHQAVNTDGNAAKLTQNVYGLFVGGDEAVGSNGWRLGGSLGFTKADAKVKERDASATIKSYSASLYAGNSYGYGADQINVMVGMAYTHHRIDSQRSMPVNGPAENLKTKYSAHTAQLFGEVGWGVGQYSQQGFEPFAGLNISQQRVGSFQESGGFAALRGESSNDTYASTTLGVRAHKDMKLAGKDTRLKGTVGWRHAFGGVKKSTTMAFVEGSQNFTVTGVPLARNTALLGLQAEVELSRRAVLELGYRGEYGSGTRDQALQVKMRWAF